MIVIICVRQRTGHLEHLRRMCSADKNWIVTRMEKSNYRPNVVRSADVSLCTFIPVLIWQTRWVFTSGQYSVTNVAGYRKALEQRPNSFILNGT